MSIDFKSTFLLTLDAIALGCTETPLHVNCLHRFALRTKISCQISSLFSEGLCHLYLTPLFPRYCAWRKHGAVLHFWGPIDAMPHVPE